MALSGSLYSAVSSQGWQLRLDWSATQSTASNQSTVTMSLYVYNKYQSYNQGNTAYYTINGTKTFYKYSYGSTAGWNYCGQKVQTFTHNNDGTLSTTLTADWCSDISGSSWTPYSMSLSGSITLNTIPRASAISSASNVTAGNAVSVTWTPNASSFTFKIKFTGGSPAYDSGWINVSPARTTAYTYTGLTLALATMANACRSASSFTMTVSLATYNGSTQIGSTATKTFTVTIPNNSTTKPVVNTLTVEKADTTVPASWGIYVQGQSKVKLTEACTFYQNTSAKSYAISGGGYNGTSNPYTTGLLNTAGENTFTASVTDNRGFVSANKTATINVVAWSAPTLSNIVCVRSNSSGSEDDNGFYCHITGNSAYSSCDNKNSATTKVYYKEYGTSTWIQIHSVATVNGAFAYTVGSGSTFDTEKAYDIKIEVADQFKTSTYQDVLSTSQYTMVLRHGGNGIAFGKASELNAMESAFPAYFYNGIKGKQNPTDTEWVDVLDKLSILSNFLSVKHYTNKLTKGSYDIKTQQLYVIGDLVFLFATLTNGSAGISKSRITAFTINDADLLPLDNTTFNFRTMSNGNYLDSDYTNATQIAGWLNASGTLTLDCHKSLYFNSAGTIPILHIYAYYIKKHTDQF